MAVLKHTSPTAWPLAPKPLPQTTVPSARTRTPVAPFGCAGEGADRAMGSPLGVSAMVLSGGRYSPPPLASTSPRMNYAANRPTGRFPHSKDTRNAPRRSQASPDHGDEARRE